MRNATILLTVVAVLALAGQAWGYADGDYRWKGGNADWDASVANWEVYNLAGDSWSTATVLPTTSDPAYVENGSVVTITAAGANANALLAGYNTGTSGTITQAVGTFDASGGPYSHLGCYGAGTYNHSGGTFQVQGLYFGYGTAGASGTYNLSGTGALEGSTVAMVGASVFTQTGGSVTLTGDLQVPANLKWTGPTPEYEISGGSLSVGGALCVGDSLGRPGVFKVTGLWDVTGDEIRVEDYTQYGPNYGAVGTKLVAQIDSTGLTTIKVTDDVTFGLSGTGSNASVIVVDDLGADPGAYTIMSWGGDVTGTPTLTLPGGDWSWNSGTFASDGKIEVTLIPEPATMALLGLGGLGVLLRRRRK